MDKQQDNRDRPSTKKKESVLILSDTQTPFYKEQSKSYIILGSIHDILQHCLYKVPYKLYVNRNIRILFTQFTFSSLNGALMIFN